MKAIFKISVLPALLFAVASVGYADTITLDSAGGSYTNGNHNDTNGKLEYLGYSSLSGQCSTFPCNTPLVAPVAPTTNSASPHTSYSITNGVWETAIAGSSWVTNGYVSGTNNTGTSCGTGSNMACDPNDFYYYQTTFTAVGGAEGYFGTINVMADDTAEVLLNGVVIVAFGIVGNDSHCATGNSITGADPTPSCGAVDTVTLNNIKLTASNTLTVIVAQTNLNGAGVDFTAQLVQAPEPPSLLLFGTGLLGLAGLLRFKFLRSR